MDDLGVGSRSLAYGPQRGNCLARPSGTQSGIEWPARGIGSVSIELSNAALGSDLEVVLVEQRPDGTWLARSDDLDADGIRVFVRGADTTREAGERISGWASLIDPEHREVWVSTRDRGRLPISDGKRAAYRVALTTVVSLAAGEPGEVASLEAVSEFKGMLNRCIKRDQPDWLAVYELFGRPPIALLQRGVAAAGRLRSLAAGRSAIADHERELLGALSVHALASLDRDRPQLPGARISRAGSPVPTVGPLRTQFDVDAAKTREARALHATTLAALRKHLESVGYVVEENLHVDAYARLRTSPAIFEVKSITDANEISQVREAVSQLYEYRYRYEPQASLWLVLSRPMSQLNEWVVDYLQNDRGIGVLWMTGTESIAGPWLARLVETKHAERTRAGSTKTAPPPDG